ncbi:MAG: hypothetical protein JWO98_286 [Frankiales bacterium]|nr:hypothetical protein [Frankiales bacterium]
MTTALASGSWLVRDGSQATFVESWSAFLDSTTRSVPGLHRETRRQRGEAYPPGSVSFSMGTATSEPYSVQEPS